VTAILEFDNVVRAYSQGAPVLNGVSFNLREGEVAGLLGRNGAGKTTLIQIAMGMLYPNSGSVRAFGLSPRKDAVAVKKRIGYVAEEQILRLKEQCREQWTFPLLNPEALTAGVNPPKLWIT